MAYSDKDLRTFTQIAYTNFSDAAEILVKDSDNGNVDCTIANLESKTNPPKDGYPYNTTITDDQKQNWNRHFNDNIVRDRSIYCQIYGR